MTKRFTLTVIPDAPKARSEIHNRVSGLWIPALALRARPE
jgi:hypothetical protein